MFLSGFNSAQEIREALNFQDWDILSQLLNITDDTDPLESTVLLRAIKEADGVINAYLAGRFQRPINPVPGLLKDIHLRLTLGKLLIYRGNYTQTHPYYMSFEDAIEDLRKIAKGGIPLVYPTENRALSDTLPTNITPGSNLSESEQDDYRNTIGRY